MAKRIGTVYNSAGVVHLKDRFTAETQRAARERAHVDALCERLSKELGTRVVAQFSSKAGCTMCPCSPGFVLYVDEITPAVEQVRRLEIWLTRTGRVERRSEGN